jgi:hypothetical protein
MQPKHHLRLISIFGIFVFSFSVSCSLMFYACKKSNPVAPPPPVGADTSSNDFIWSQTPIGTYGTELQDIVAFSDTDVWICGEIDFKDSNTFDSLGNWITPFNVAHFNGRKWEYIRIHWGGIPANQYSSATAILGMNVHEIWFSNGPSLAL